MSSKSEKLVQRIQDVQKFAIAKVDRSSTFGSIAEELGNLIDTLKVSKFKVKIASKYPILGQALQNFVSTQTLLTSRYQFQMASLPTPPQPIEPESPASLLLKLPNGAGVQKTRYLLSSDRKMIIGRNPDCQIKIPLECSEVSRHHAEVRPFLNSTSGKSNFSWMLCDLNSANGTYVNDILLNQGACHILQPGDRIVLGKPNTTVADPELIFELQVKLPVPQIDESKQILTSCDVLCLVINPAQPISAAEKQLIEQANKAQLFKLVIVVNVSADERTNPSLTANIAELASWLSDRSYSQTSEIVDLDLLPFYPNHQNQNIEPQVREQGDRLMSFLEDLTNTEGEDTLKERVKKRFLAQLSAIDNVFNEQIELINSQIKKQQESLGGKTIEEINEQIKKALKQITEDKEKTFQQVKFEFNQSKASLVDAFSKKSLLYKIQLFTDDLKPVITKEQGQILLRLRSQQMPESESIHSYATRICNTEIFKWSNEEWGRICQHYQTDGLKGFFQRTYAALNLIPSLQLAPELFQPAPKFDGSKCLQASVVEFNKTHIAYQESSKKGDVLVASGAGAIAVAFGNPIPLIMAGINIFNKNAAQQQALDNRQEQQTEALKKGICSHYQSLAKYLTEKVVQGFVLGFQTEERRVKEIVEKTVEQINDRLLAVKKGIEECKANQNILNKEKAEVLEILKKP
jgi:pSer/pThr/pTyr-binding forkhead associated (FHA) protein